MKQTALTVFAITIGLLAGLGLGRLRWRINIKDSKSRLNRFMLTIWPDMIVIALMCLAALYFLLC